MFPSEKKGIKSLFKEIKNNYDGIYKFDRIRTLTPEFIFSINNTCDKLLNKYIEHPKLKTIIFQLWPYFGLPPSSLPIFYFCYPWYDFFKSGGFYPLGGGKAIIDTLTTSITKNNGDILFNSNVKKIINKNNTAKGVIVNEGAEYFGNTIISNIDAFRTFKNLVEDKMLPSEFLKELNNLEPSISA